MCGIVGYVGTKNAAHLVTQGLCDVSYRGYQAAGLVFIDQGALTSLRVSGDREGILSVDALRMDAQRYSSNIAIGHTRWPTHGGNTLRNTHPHRDCRERVFVVHNGTLSNFDQLKRVLQARGHEFNSETDTEVIAHLIEDEIAVGMSLADAVQQTLPKLEGAYAIAVMSSVEPEVIVAARLGSPLLLGISEHGCAIASDEVALARFASKVIEVKEGEVLTLMRDGVHGNSAPARDLNVQIEEVDRGGFEYFMMKEMCEQAKTVASAMNFGGRIDLAEGNAHLGGLRAHKDRLRSIERLVLVGCGTAYYAALIARHYFMKIGGLKIVDAVVASEFEFLGYDAATTAIIAISQSGETYDTKRIVEEANNRGILTIGVVNRAGSWIARNTVCGVYCNAGVEKAVASTKVFLAQLTVMYLMAVFMGRQRVLTREQGIKLLDDVQKLPTILEAYIQEHVGEHGSIAGRVWESIEGPLSFVAFIGRGILAPIAREGALKLKEISYIPAHGYEAGELKHGPLALLDSTRPTVVLIGADQSDHLFTTLHEVVATESPVYVIAPHIHRDRLESMFANARITYFYIPSVSPYLEPMCMTLPLQAFAYHIARFMDLPIDTPRNLAKSVTVA